ncbi:MAG TPA: hypothetical protein VGM88_00900 [Kofleriaceae bacterium]|jgi:hypothetical protein
MPSPLATYVVSVPAGALRCTDGKLKIEAANAPVAVLVAKMPESSELSAQVWEAILEAFNNDASLVAAASSFARPRVIYTLDGAAEKKGKTWRVPFTAYLLDMGPA